MVKDNFSKQAALYAKYRPVYPQELFDFIFSITKQRESAWDCATGNGQSAKELSKHFRNVYATDISQKQIDNAYAATNIHYSIQPAEKTDFNDNAFDLVTVSQALHWFQFDKFYTEVNRVTKPGGYLAVWMYNLLKITPVIDDLIQRYHDKTLESYWDKERKYVDENYAGIPFPFEKIECLVFKMQYKWTLKELEGYLHTWSALQKFVEANHYNPADELVKQIEPYWQEEKMTIIFPLYLRMGKIIK